MNYRLNLYRGKVGVPFELYQAWMHARQLEVPSWLLERERERLKAAAQEALDAKEYKQVTTLQIPCD